MNAFALVYFCFFTILAAYANQDGGNRRNPGLSRIKRKPSHTITKAQLKALRRKKPVNESAIFMSDASNEALKSPLLNTFISAIEKDDRHLLASVLEKGFPTNFMIPYMPCYDTMGPLMIAAHNGSLSVCKVLLKHNGGVDLAVKSMNNKRTAAVWALFAGHLDVVEFFLKLGVDLPLQLASALFHELKMTRTLKLDCLTKAVPFMKRWPAHLKKGILMRALRCNCSLDVVQILVSTGVGDSKPHKSNQVLFEVFYWMLRMGYDETSGGIVSVQMRKAIFEPLCFRYRDVINLKLGGILLLEEVGDNIELVCILIQNGAQDGTPGKRPILSKLSYDEDRERAELEFVKTKLVLAACGTTDEGSSLWAVPMDIVMGQIGKKMLEQEDEENRNEDGSTDFAELFNVSEESLFVRRRG